MRSRAVDCSILRFRIGPACICVAVICLLWDPERLIRLIAQLHSAIRILTWCVELELEAAVLGLGIIVSDHDCLHQIAR